MGKTKTETAETRGYSSLQKALVAIKGFTYPILNA